VATGLTGQSTFDTSCGTADLTPERLASFYRTVGGNYDTLFLDTNASALSFIYQSLGCFHSLQPSTNAFDPPSIPALLPSGFVRWLTIQILLDPSENCEYLQNAVARWDIVKQDGSVFPKSIPRDAFPTEPDSEMVQWHEEVSRRLEHDYWKRNTPRPSPGVFTYGYSPGDAHSNEGYFSRTHYPTNHRRAAHSPRRNRHQRHGSAECPPRRVQSASFQRRGHRSGFASPRAPSPPRWPDRSTESRSGSLHTLKTVFSLGAESDASSEDSPSSRDRLSRKRNGRRNLGVPHESRARPHSHEAYSRKPRETSPAHCRRHSHRDAYHSTHPRHLNSDRSTSYWPSTELPQRPTNARFQEFTFLDPGIALGAEHARPRHVPARKAPGNLPPHHRADREDRRYSYSGGGSGGSSERTRPYTDGVHRAQRCVPVYVEDVLHTPGRPAKYGR
jgi:hypothetical protein